MSRPSVRKFCTKRGGRGVMPSMSCITSTCASVPAPAPMPITGIGSCVVMSLASVRGTHSSTSSAAPAAVSTFASSRMRCAAAGSRPCTTKPPKLFTDCGVSPRWTQTGTPRSLSSRTVSASQAPPSIFTMCAPACIRIAALRMASSGVA